MYGTEARKNELLREPLEYEQLPMFWRLSGLYVTRNSGTYFDILSTNSSGVNDMAVTL